MWQVLRMTRSADSGLDVELLEHLVGAGERGVLRDPRSWIVHVSEHDRIRRARSLARSDNIAVANGLTTNFRFDLRTPNSLDAVGALLHNTTAADRHIGVQHHAGQIVVHLENGGVQFTDRGLVLVVREAVGAGIIGPVEPAYLERTVIGAIPCTYTTVVSHVVQTF